MTSPAPLDESRWYRIAIWSVAISAPVALAYFFARTNGLVPGDPGPTSSRLQLSAATCLIWSVLLRRRPLIAVALIGLAAILMASAVLSLSRGN